MELFAIAHEVAHFYYEQKAATESSSQAGTDLELECGLYAGGEIFGRLSDAILVPSSRRVISSIELTRPNRRSVGMCKGLLNCYQSKA